MSSVVEVVRTFAVAPFSSGTLVLNLASGLFFHLESHLTASVLELARGLPTAEIEEHLADRTRLPRYVARERVRTLQLQLEAPFALPSSLPLADKALIRVDGRVKVSDTTGLLRPGEGPKLRAVTLRTSEGLLLVGGNAGVGKTSLADGLTHLGLTVHQDGEVAVPIVKEQVRDFPLSQAWFLQPKRRSGLGLVLARKDSPFALSQFLGHVVSSHPRGAWVEIFKAFAQFTAELPAFEVSVPEGTVAMREAVGDFAGAHGFRPRDLGVPCQR